LEVSYDDARLAKICASEQEMQRKYGTERTKKLRVRLKDLRAAETLEDMKSMPGHCHELTGDRAGSLALDLEGPHRLLFRPTEITPPGPGGGLDWTAVRAVTVEGIENYHD
jgi:proteic killer suppression protein